MITERIKELEDLVDKVYMNNLEVMAECQEYLPESFGEDDFVLAQDRCYDMMMEDLEEQLAEAKMDLTEEEADFVSSRMLEQICDGLN